MLKVQKGSSPMSRRNLPCRICRDGELRWTGSQYACTHCRYTCKGTRTPAPPTLKALGWPKRQAWWTRDEVTT